LDTHENTTISHDCQQKNAEKEVVGKRNFCGKAVFYHEKHGWVEWRCGRARCHNAECQTHYANQVRNRINDAAIKGNLRFLLTLTLPKDIPLPEAWNNISYYWDKFAQRMRRRYPRFQYSWVIEPHQDGYPHIHALISEFLDIPTACSAWSESVGCGRDLSPGVDVRQVADDASEYMTKGGVFKYLTKGGIVQSCSYLPGRKRCRGQSMGIDAEIREFKKNFVGPPLPPSGWAFVAMTPAMMQDNEIILLDKPYKVRYDDTKERATDIPHDANEEPDMDDVLPLGWEKLTLEESRQIPGRMKLIHEEQQRQYQLYLKRQSCPHMPEQIKLALDIYENGFFYYPT